MGQGDSISCGQHGDVLEERWRWTDENKWPSDGSESSDDESGPVSSASRESPSSPSHDPGGGIPDCCSNNNVASFDEDVLSGHLEDPSEVVDVAGGGNKPIHCPPPDPDTVVVCHTERPVAAHDVWLSLPPPEQRLAAYHVVAIMDPILVVVHTSRPLVRLALKVLRKSCWPVETQSSGVDPRPVPNMVRLVDWIETEDAVFVVTDFVTEGLLWDHVRIRQDPVQDTLSERVPTPDPSLDVDALVMQAQRLLASVNRTLERSALQQQELKTVESVLASSERKSRSKSVLPRPRLERRFSSDDVTGRRPRTAHPSLDRVSRKHHARASELAVREWGAALVASLDTLHTRGIIWRDLHPGNLLWAHGGRLMLSFHHKWSGVERPLHTAAVAGLFVAPEVFSVFPVSPACDWWTVGVLLYELLTGTALVEVHPTGLESHTILDIPDFLSVEARSLLIGFLQYEPNERLGGGTYGSEEIKCHPFFKAVDWEFAYGEV